MSKTPQITIHDVTTDEVAVRAMTAEELKIFEADQADTAALVAAQNARDEARQAILDRLGITADEAKLLLG